MLRQPRFKTLTIEDASSHIEHQSFLFIYFRNDLEAVQNEKDFHRSVSDPFIAIQKRMIEREGVTQRGGLRRECRVKVGSAEGRARLGECRLETVELPDAGCAAAAVDERLVERNDLTQRDVSHYASRL